MPESNKTLMMEVPIEDVGEKNGIEGAVHQQDDDSDTFVEDREFNGCIRTLASNDITPSNDRIHLGVVRYTTTQPQQVND